MADELANTESKPTEATNAFEAEWVFAGKRISSKHELLEEWIPLRPDGMPEIDERYGEPKALWYSSLVPTAGVGQIYRFRLEKHENGSLTVLGKNKQWGQYVRYWTNAWHNRTSPEEISEDDKKKTQWMREWSLKSRAAETELDMMKRQKKEKTDELVELLKPVKELLKPHFGRNRRLMIAVIMDYLTN